MKSIVITKGFHYPFNQGEIVLTKAYVELLTQVYDEVIMISAIDFFRGYEGFWKNSYKNLSITYVVSIKDVHSVINKFLEKEPFDLHVFNVSLLELPYKLIKKTNRIYFYQFALHNIRALSTFLRTNIILLSSILQKKLIIITASPSVYNYARKLHFNIIYIPVPIETGSLINTSVPRNPINEFINILYIGHPDPVRLPINKIAPVFYDLHKKGYNFKFEIYLSKQRFKDYTYFYKIIKNTIEKTGLSSRIRVILKNLNENEKKSIYEKSDIFLYPALAEAAIDPPLTVLEAMSHGLCVIATDVQSIPFILKNKRGVIVKRSSLILSLYKTFLLLLKDVSKIECCKIKAVDYIIKYHDKDTVLRVFEKKISE